MVSRKPQRTRVTDDEIDATKDLEILSRLAREQSQEYIAKVLGMSQQAVSKRLNAIDAETRLDIGRLILGSPDRILSGQAYDRAVKGLVEVRVRRREMRRLERINRAHP